MSARLTVSIALCTFEGERFLKPQLESFAAQTRLPDELVVCDDGSSDATLAILEAWAETVPFEVRILRNERNLGYAQNFGKTISLCSKDVIFLSDQDDVWEPEKIEKMTAVFEAEPDVGLVVSDGFIIDESGKRQPGSMQELVRPWFFDETNGFCECVPRPEDAYPQGCASAFRASLKPVLLPIPALWSHDIWLQAVSHAVSRGRVLPEFLFSYRLYSANTSGFGSFEDRIRLWERKKRIYVWNMPQQFWAWVPRIGQFRERMEALPESEKKTRILRQLQRNVRHYENRNRIQRSLLIYGFLWGLELLRGGYAEHLFPIRSAFFDLRTGFWSALNPVRTFREVKLLWGKFFPQKSE